MFVSPAYAQTAGAAGGTESLLITILPFVAVFAIMYFLIIRPQRRQMKKRDEMLGGFVAQPFQEAPIA